MGMGGTPQPGPRRVPPEIAGMGAPARVPAYFKASDSRDTISGEVS